MFSGKGKKVKIRARKGTRRGERGERRGQGGAEVQGRERRTEWNKGKEEEGLKRCLTVPTPNDMEAGRERGERRGGVGRDAFS